MKKNFLLAALCSLFVSATFAQSSPLAPKDYQSKVSNSIKLYRVIKYVDIPVYLNTPDNKTITYCWYKTKISFGEKVRISDNPIQVEVGEYINGRLSMYNTGSYIYKLEWRYDGYITKIVKYNNDGTVINSDSYTYYDANREIRLYGGAVRARLDKPFWLRNYTSIGDEYRLNGYTVSSGKIVEMTIYLTPKGRKYPNQWNQRVVEEVVASINPDGSFGSGFDFNDNVRCASFEN